MCSFVAARDAHRAAQYKATDRLVKAFGQGGWLVADLVSFRQRSVVIVNWSQRIAKIAIRDEYAFGTNVVGRRIKGNDEVARKEIFAPHGVDGFRIDEYVGEGGCRIADVRI